MKKQFEPVIKKLKDYLAAKKASDVTRFRDFMTLSAACFLTFLAIYNPFAKDIFFKLIAALFFFIGYLDTNPTRQRIFMSIGMVFFMLVVLISYKVISY